MTKYKWLLIAALACLLVLPGAAWAKTAVVVVDVQADFTTAHDGSLAVKGSDRAYLQQVEEATVKLKKAGLLIVATQDWHPGEHMSFASNQKGKKPFQAITLADGRTQVLWPDHCVQGTPGAKLVFEPKLAAAVVQKGRDRKFDSYSGFKDDGGAATGLEKLLKDKGVTTIIVYGIATDYCVKATVIDGLKAGFKVVVVQDLCRGVDPKTSAEGWKAMQAAGATLWPSLDLAKASKL